MGEGSGTTLGALTAPHGAAQFLRDHWPGRAFVAHGSPERLPAFLRASELASVDTLARVYRGKLRFTRGRAYQKMVAIEQVSATSLYRMGLTVQFEDVAPFVPDAAPALRRLEAELGIPTGSARASVFSSPQTDGLSEHFDAQDLFSIQLKGTKRFRFAPVDELPYPSGTQFVPATEPFDFLYPQVSGGFPDPESAAFQAVDMAPGSVLYIPRGTWHATESGGDSLSVSIGLYLPSAADCVLEQLQLLLVQDPEWRRPLYGAWGNGPARADAATRLARLIERLPRDCASLSVDDTIAGLRSHEERLAGISKASRFQKTPHSRLATEPGAQVRGQASEIVLVRLADPSYGERTSMRLEVTREAAAVFRWIGESRAAFAASELCERFPAFPFEHHRQLLEAAAHAGLVRMLWFPALAREMDAVPPGASGTDPKL
jgi:ribosomal protein L16 Arg81 hydroxylase